MGLGEVRGGRKVGKREVDGITLLAHGPLSRLDLVAGSGGVTIGNLTAQAQLAGERQVLRNSQADIGEVAVSVSGKRPRTSDTEVLHRDLRIWQSGYLRGNLCGSHPAVARR